MDIATKLTKKPSVFDVLDGMITDTIQHSKIKNLMKNIATEESARELSRADDESGQDEIPQKTAELADLDGAGVRENPHKERNADRGVDGLAIAMMDMMEKIEGLERENKAISDKLARAETGKITDITLNNILQKISPDTIEIVNSYGSIETCMKENAGLTYSGLNDAIANKKIYGGYYWRWISIGDGSGGGKSRGGRFVAGGGPDQPTVASAFSFTDNSVKSPPSISSYANRGGVRMRGGRPAADISVLSENFINRSFTNVINPPVSAVPVKSSGVFSKFLERIPDKSVRVNTAVGWNTDVMRLNK